MAHDVCIGKLRQKGIEGKMDAWAWKTRRLASNRKTELVSRDDFSGVNGTGTVKNRFPNSANCGLILSLLKVIPSNAHVQQKNDRIRKIGRGDCLIFNVYGSNG